MIYLAYILIGMLVLRFLVVLANFLSKPFLPEIKDNLDLLKVSVLIPARNEEKTLPMLLADLAQLDYPNFEIIVCDDHSEDSTKKVLGRAMETMPQLSFFTKAVLPKGWIGKNHACYELAQRATGEYLLFLDSDVRVQAQLLKQLLSFAVKKKTKLLSLFPRQIIQSPGEWKTVPIMNWILLSFLPLRLVQWKMFASLSAANGQCMFFEGENYRQNQWHKEVKSNNVDDILIAKRMKRRKFKIATLLGRNDVACRMYKNYEEGIHGFSRNIHQYFGGSRMWMLLFVLLVWVRIPLLAVISWPLGIVALLMLALMKLMVADLSRMNVLRNCLFHFQQLLALTRISIRNLRSTKSLSWKGRIYNN